MIGGTENLPFVVAGISATAGAMTDLAMQYWLTSKRTRAAEIYGQDVIARSPRRVSRIGRMASSSILFTTASAGYVNTVAWQEEAAPQIIDPVVEVVVDRSGGTAVGDNPAAPQIDLLLRELADSDLDTEAIVTSLGDTETMELDEALAQRPFGDANLAQAMITALDSAQNRKIDKTEESGLTANAAIIAVTNGNRLTAEGTAADLIEQARRIPAPITIVNVTSNVRELGVAEELEAIAEETGGEYFDIEEDGSVVIERVAEDLVDRQQAPNETGNQWKVKVFGALLIAGTIACIFHRRREPIVTNSEIEGE